MVYPVKAVIGQTLLINTQVLGGYQSTTITQVENGETTISLSVKHIRGFDQTYPVSSAYRK